jgi:transcriptional regulator with XRE-family HTH domain
VREVFLLMMPRQHLSPDRRRLAAALRELREDTGLSAERFGEPHGWSQGKVSKIENGRTVPSTEDATAWATAAGHPERATELAKLAESVGVQTRGYAGRAGDTLATRAEQAGELESLSTVVRVFQTAMVPGLLQTAGYARCVLEMLDRPEDEIPAAVNARMQRQDALYQPGRRFEFVLTEGALRWRPGPAEMMAAQYERLLRVAGTDGVELRVLPFAMRAPTFYDNPFTIYEIPDDPTVLAEGTPAEQFYRQEDKLEVCRTAFSRGWDVALTGEDALRAIASLQRELSAG